MKAIRFFAIFLIICAMNKSNLSASTNTSEERLWFNNIETRIGISILPDLMSYFVIDSDHPIDNIFDGWYDETGPNFFNTISLDLELVIKSKFNFDIFVASKYVIDEGERINWPRSTNEDLRGTKMWSLNGGNTHIGLSRKLGGEIFGLETRIGLGLSSYTRRVTSRIIDDSGESRERYNYYSTDSYTNFSGLMSVGPYLRFGGFSLNTSYWYSHSAKDGVGGNYIHGIQFCLGFAY